LSRSADLDGIKGATSQIPPGVFMGYDVLCGERKVPYGSAVRGIWVEDGCVGWIALSRGASFGVWYEEGFYSC